MCSNLILFFAEFSHPRVAANAKSTLSGNGFIHFYICDTEFFEIWPELARELRNFHEKLKKSKLRRAIADDLAVIGKEFGLLSRCANEDHSGWKLLKSGRAVNAPWKIAKVRMEIWVTFDSQKITLLQ